MTIKTLYNKKITEKRTRQNDLCIQVVTQIQEVFWSNRPMDMDRARNAYP